jgi:hypothetical protein
MGQIFSIRMHKESEAPAARDVLARDVLGWARVAGIVELRPDGSWHLTELGRARVLRLVRKPQRPEAGIERVR